MFRFVCNEFNVIGGMLDFSIKDILMSEFSIKDILESFNLHHVAYSSKSTRSSVVSCCNKPTPPLRLSIRLD